MVDSYHKLWTVPAIFTDTPTQVAVKVIFTDALTQVALKVGIVSKKCIFRVMSREQNGGDPIGEER